MNRKALDKEGYMQRRPRDKDTAQASRRHLEGLVPGRGAKLVSSDTREQYREKIARITLDSMVQFVGLLDAQGTVLEINNVALDAVGIRLSDVEGKPFWATFWWQVSEEIRATLKESILRASQGEFVRWDTEIYGRAGGTETIIIDASLSPVRDEQGNVVFICAEGRDITEKKAYEREIARQREELAQLDVLKTQFFANISHEFRTPLALMLGPLEDALSNAHGVLSTDAVASLTISHRNALRLLKLVNTMLDFSRIEAGRIQASYHPADLSTLTAELASNFRSLCDKAGLQLIVDCAPFITDEPAYVDRDMWEKIVLNLISNAFKFTLQGKIEVRLETSERQARLTARDTGVGIPAEELPRMFERFHRIERNRGRTHEGTGIGLALVQELVKLHGGTITVASVLGEGSTFTVAIPLGNAHLDQDRIGKDTTLASTAVRHEAFVEEAWRWLPEATGARSENPIVNKAEATRSASPPSSFQLLVPLPQNSVPSFRHSAFSPRILLADDNADMREYVARLLSAQYEVDAVADGEAALALSRQRPPDLVLADVMMPGLDGFGLLRALRADTDTSIVPVILLSARAGEESRIEGLAAGADDYIVKPFSARELLARVGAHVEIARVRQEAAHRERALRHEAEAAREQVTRILESIADGFYTVGHDWRFTYVNPRAKEIWREDHPDVLGKRLWDEFPGAEELIFGEQLHKAMTEQVTVNFEGYYPPWEAWLDVRAYPAPEGIAVYFHDITTRKAAEAEHERLFTELQRINSELRQFAHIVSHDLNEPLRTMRNFIQLLARHMKDTADTDINECMAFVTDAAQRMQQMLADLLAYTRAGQTPEFQAVDGEEVLVQVLNRLQAQITECEAVVTHDPLPTLQGDATRLGQVLQNLIGNALKFRCPGTPPLVHVSAHREGQHWKFGVHDNGIGIDPAQTKLLFQVFQRIHTRSEYPGTGIGLAICKRIVEQHGGRIWVESQPSAGSIFYFTIRARGVGRSPSTGLRAEEGLNKHCR